MAGLSAGGYLRCFLRSYCVSAAYNPHGLQNIGFMYAIEPALAALYGPGERLCDARLRYARHYNCHPFFTPLFLGVLLHMETAIAERQLDPAMLVSLKDTTANTLSAIGDSFFNGSLLGTWALSAACLVLAGLPEFALRMTALCWIFLQAFKFGSFLLGLRKGMCALTLFAQLDLINRSDYCKSLNGVLLAVLLWLALPDAPFFAWCPVILYLLLAGWLVGRTHVPRTCMALVLLTITVALHFFGLFACLPALLCGL